MSLKNGLNGTPSSESSEIAALLSSLKENLPDDCTSSSYNREKLRETAQKLSLALETPGETAQRIVYLVRWPHLPGSEQTQAKSIPMHL